MSRSTIPETPRSRITTSTTTTHHGRTDSVRSTHSSGGPPTTPQMARVAVGSVVQSSPHYTTTRRHSLYGTEDRIILDLGSRIWKIGFSGEGRPRDVFYAVREEEDVHGYGFGSDAVTGGVGESSSSLWSLERPREQDEREETARQLEAIMQKKLRFVFHESLLTDPKSRKIIIVENPLLPIYVKDMIAKILFENLQVPSISFASSHLLSLFAVGRITGLVLDCGYLESTALPIFASRPLFTQLRATPLAGSRLTSHLRALLLMFASYIPPPSATASAVSMSATSRAVPVPEEVLTDKVMEEAKTRCCFVGEVLEETMNDFVVDSRRTEINRGGLRRDEEMDVDDYTNYSEAGPSSPSRADESMDIDDLSQPPPPPLSSSSPIRSSFHLASPSPDRAESHLQTLARLYKRYSTATDLTLRVEHPTSLQPGIGRGTLVIPGWIRERGAEVLFEGGDVDESSVAEIILDVLLKVPLDLRRLLASSILIIGGTSMLPGFIPRLHSELIKILSRPSPTNYPPQPRKPVVPVYDPYAPLRSLKDHIAILNNPSPPVNGHPNGGRAPAFTPAILAWVGGSLTGSLKIGGEEILREKWDEAADTDGDTTQDSSQSLTLPAPAPPSEEIEEHPPPASSIMSGHRRKTYILPDWTRVPLGSGAPHVPRHISTTAQQAAVGA